MLGKSFAHSPHPHHPLLVQFVPPLSHSLSSTYRPLMHSKPERRRLILRALEKSQKEGQLKQIQEANRRVLSWMKLSATEKSWMRLLHVKKNLLCHCDNMQIFSMFKLHIQCFWTRVNWIISKETKFGFQSRKQASSRVRSIGSSFKHWPPCWRTYPSWPCQTTMSLFFLLHVDGNSDCLYHVFARSSFRNQTLRAWTSIFSKSTLSNIIITDIRQDSASLVQHLQSCSCEELFDPDAAFPRKEAQRQIVWCHECKAPCMNEVSLAQHRVRKKHSARLFALEAARSEAAPAVVASRGVLSDAAMVADGHQHGSNRPRTS